MKPKTILFLCCSTTRITNRQTYQRRDDTLIFRQDKVNTHLRDLFQWLNNGRTQIASGDKIFDTIKSNDLHIVWYGKPKFFQVSHNKACQMIGAAEYTIKIKCAVFPFEYFAWQYGTNAQIQEPLTVKLS